MDRELISKIAQEAHTMGHIYTKGGEKLNPANEFQRVEKMIDRFISNAKEHTVQADAHGCSLCVPYHRVIPNAKFCGACGAPLN